MDFGVLIEVADEAVLYLQAAQADDAEHQNQRIKHQHASACPIGKPRQGASEIELQFAVGRYLLLRQQAEHRRKQGEHHQQRCGHAHHHDPAEGDDRGNAADDQRSKGHCGGERCVQAGLEHDQDGVAQNLAMVAEAAGGAQLPVAHDQVDVEGNGEDQQQRDEVGRDHSHPPVHQPEYAHHNDTGYGAAGQRQQYPAQAAEDQSQHQHDEGEDAQAEGGQIRLHEADQIVGNHGRAAQVELGAIPVAVENGADLTDVLMAQLGGLTAVTVEFATDLFQLLCLRLGQSTVALQILQLGTAVDQADVALIQLEADQQGAGLAVLTDDGIAEYGAVDQFLARCLAVHVRIFQGLIIFREPHQRGVAEDGDV